MPNVLNFRNCKRRLTQNVSLALRLFQTSLLAALMGIFGSVPKLMSLVRNELCKPVQALEINFETLEINYVWASKMLGAESIRVCKLD